MENYTERVEHEDKAVFYYKYGFWHRLDGPAIIYPGGYKEWWINGINYTKKEYGVIALFMLLEKNRF